MTTEYKMFIKASQLYGDNGSVTAEWSVESFPAKSGSSEINRIIEDARSCAANSDVFSTTVFGAILLSTDHDTTNIDPSTLSGPFALVVSHESYEGDDDDVELIEDEIEVDVIDNIILFDTFDAASKAYKVELSNRSLYMAAVVCDIKFSNVYKNGVEVSRSIMMQQDRAPKSLTQGVAYPSKKPTSNSEYTL